MRRRGRRRAVALAGLIAAATAACTEDTLVGVDPQDAPGRGAATVEIEIPAAELPAWRDTTYTGYALPSTSGVRLLVDEPALRVRVLGRFPTIPDSLFIEEERVEIERFENARLRLVLDTLSGRLPEGGTEITAWSLARGFTARDATWSEASTNEPWTTPGGDFDLRLGTLLLDDPGADTVFVPLSVEADSLLRSWRSAEGEPGLALVVDGGDTRLTVGPPVLVFDARPVGRDTLVETLRSASPSTFIFDPQATPPSGAMRIGTLPAARSYVNFRLPETVDGVSLRGARINRATLLLASTGAPPEAFAASDTLLALGFALLSDPFEFGPKTPIGGNTSAGVLLPPEELAAGGDIEIPITGLVQQWAASDPADRPALNLGVRLLPEGGGLAYWEFGTVEDAERQPRVRLLVTPSTPFDLP